MKVTQLYLSLWPHELYSPWNSPGQNTGVGSHFLLQDLPNPRIEPISPALQVDSLPAEPPGKPTNTVKLFISLCLSFSFFLHAFWCFLIGCIYICNCFILLMNWLFYHSKMPHFISNLYNFFCIKIANSDFLWLFSHDIYFSSFYFQCVFGCFLS